MSRSGEPVELRDILPTVLEAAAIKTSRPLDGVVSSLRMQGQGWRDWIDLDQQSALEERWFALPDNYDDGRWSGGQKESSC